MAACLEIYKELPDQSNMFGTDELVPGKDAALDDAEELLQSLTSYLETLKAMHSCVECEIYCHPDDDKVKRSYVQSSFESCRWICAECRDAKIKKWADREEAKPCNVSYLAEKRHIWLGECDAANKLDEIDAWLNEADMAENDRRLDFLNFQNYKSLYGLPNSTKMTNWTKRRAQSRERRWHW